MKKFLLFVFLSVFTIGAFADQPTVAGAATEATQWGQLAKDIGEAIGIAAHGVGVAVNDFITSPAGILTVVLIIGKMLGKGLVLVPFLIFVAWVGARIIRALWTKEIAPIETRGLLGRPKTGYRRIYYNWEEAKDTQICAAALVVILGLCTYALTIVNW